MTKKNWLLIFFAVALAAVYVIWFSDWFHPATVKIFHANRNARPNVQRGARGAAMTTLMFGVNQPLRFTELKVVSLAALATNKDAVPVWHLVTDSNSVLVKSFYYGEPIRGMRPALKGVRPEPLETNVTYRMFITAGKVKGEHDFDLK